MILQENEKELEMSAVAEEVQDFVTSFLKIDTNIEELKPDDFIQWGKQEPVPAIILKMDDGSINMNFFSKSEMGWIWNDLIQNMKGEDISHIPAPEEIKLSSRCSVFKFDLWINKIWFPKASFCFSFDLL